MNRQEARVAALRNISGYALNVMENHYSVIDDDPKAEVKIWNEMVDIRSELDRRADQIERNLTLKPKRSKKR